MKNAPTEKQIAARFKKGQNNNPHGCKGNGGMMARKTQLQRAKQGDRLSRIEVQAGIIEPRVAKLERVVEAQALIIQNLLNALIGEEQ